MISGNLKEKDDDIVWLGQDPNAPFLAYGDDTKFGEILLYAFLIVERSFALELDKQLLELKEKLSIPGEAPIHTKDFLNGFKRQKLGIEHLNVAEMIDGIIHLINRGRCCIFYNYLRTPKNGRIYPENLEIGGKQIHGDHKAIVHQLAASCFLPFVKLRGRYVTLKDMEVFVSQETTKTKTVGSQKRQAQFLSEMRIPTTFPIQKGCYARLKPHYIPTNQSLFCQIADVIAYVLAHALSKKCKNDNYKKQMGRIAHLYKSPAG